MCCSGPMAAAATPRTWAWEIGVTINQRGQIEVDETFGTSVENIFAVGDVIGPPAWPAPATTRGRFVGHLIADGSCDWELLGDIPTGIYTSPEISSVGRNERELTEQNIPYEVGRADFKNLARAQIAGRSVGMLKLLFHRETWRCSVFTVSASRPRRSCTSARPSCRRRVRPIRSTISPTPRSTIRRWRRPTGWRRSMDANRIR